MWRRSFSSVFKLRDNTKPRISSSETSVNFGVTSWQSTYLIELDVRNPLVVFSSQMNEKGDPTPGLAIDNFKPRLKNGIFKIVTWLNGLNFGDDDRGSLKEGVKTYQMRPMSLLNPPTFFFPIFIQSVVVERFFSLFLAAVGCALVMLLQHQDLLPNPSQRVAAITLLHEAYRSDGCASSPFASIFIHLFVRSTMLVNSRHLTMVRTMVDFLQRLILWEGWISFLSSALYTWFWVELKVCQRPRSSWSSSFQSSLRESTFQAKLSFIFLHLSWKTWSVEYNDDILNFYRTVPMTTSVRSWNSLVSSRVFRLRRRTSSPTSSPIPRTERYANVLHSLLSPDVTSTYKMSWTMDVQTKKKVGELRGDIGAIW